MHAPLKLSLALVCTFSAVAAAQDAATTASKPTPTTTTPTPIRERLLKASQLPRKTAEVREKGVPDKDVKETVKAAKDKGLSAGDTSEITSEQIKAINDHGPTDNFGAFVNSKLSAGLRGRELAAAIRAEHAKRGKGKGFKPEKGPDVGKSAEKSKNAQKAEPVKRDEVKIKPAPSDKDKPDSKSKDKDKGKDKDKDKGKPDKDPD